MLKNISPLLSPELLKVMAEMGHGSELVLGDANFPAAEYGKRVIRLDGVAMVPLLDGILELLPLDYAVDAPVILMGLTDMAKHLRDPPIWSEYRSVVDKWESKDTGIEWLDRFAFYERAKMSYCIVATGERAGFANIILKKGVIR